MNTLVVKPITSISDSTILADGYNYEAIKVAGMSYRKMSDAEGYYLGLSDGNLTMTSMDTPDYIGKVPLKYKINDEDEDVYDIELTLGHINGDDLKIYYTDNIVDSLSGRDKVDLLQIVNKDSLGNADEMTYNKVLNPLNSNISDVVNNTGRLLNYNTTKDAVESYFSSIDDTVYGNDVYSIVRKSTSIENSGYTIDPPVVSEWVHELDLSYKMTDYVRYTLNSLDVDRYQGDPLAYTLVMVVRVKYIANNLKLDKLKYDENSLDDSDPINITFNGYNISYLSKDPNKSTVTPVDSEIKVHESRYMYWDLIPFNKNGESINDPIYSGGGDYFNVKVVLKGNDKVNADTQSLRVEPKVDWIDEYYISSISDFYGFKLIE